jgi:hypothetical protein
LGFVFKLLNFWQTLKMETEFGIDQNYSNIFYSL